MCADDLSRWCHVIAALTSLDDNSEIFQESVWTLQTVLRRVPFHVAGLVDDNAPLHIVVASMRKFVVVSFVFPTLDVVIANLATYVQIETPVQVLVRRHNGGQFLILTMISLLLRVACPPAARDLLSFSFSLVTDRALATRLCGAGVGMDSFFVWECGTAERHRRVVAVADTSNFCWTPLWVHRTAQAKPKAFVVPVILGMATQLSLCLAPVSGKGLALSPVPVQAFAALLWPQIHTLMTLVRDVLQ